MFASGAVAGKVIGVLMLPVLTRRLSTAEFGRLDVLSTLVSAAVSALLIGLEVAAIRLYTDAEPDRRRSLHATWYVLSTALVLPLSTALVVLAPRISRILFGQPDEAFGVAMAGVATLMGTWLAVGLTILRSQSRPRAHAAITGGSLFLNALVSVFLLFRWHADLGSVMMAMAFSQAAGAIAVWLMVRREAVARPTREAAVALLSLALPVAPAVVAQWIGEFVNRAILLRARGPVEVGYLSLATRFGSIAVLVATGFHYAWQPHAFAQGSDPAALRRLASDGRRIATAVSATVVLVALISPEAIVLIAGRRYLPALPAIGFQLLVAFGMGLYLIVSMPSAISRSMGDLGISGAVAVATAIGLNVVLSRLGGSAGTAAAMLMGQLAGVTVAAVFGARRVELPVAWPALVGLTTVTAAVVGVACLPAGGSPSWLRALLGIVFAGGMLRDPIVRAALSRLFTMHPT